ncbi:hypothetical protein V6N13_103740 [Hibiscus sabdariffa]|uniref:Uncharacterized protein n=1 Tax=Hibiscus sabdariffa TaxID=183260 RepID=A0ABR2BUD4_9ROSI
MRVSVDASGISVCTLCATFGHLCGYFVHPYLSCASLFSPCVSVYAYTHLSTPWTPMPMLCASLFAFYTLYTSICVAFVSVCNLCTSVDAYAPLSTPSDASINALCTADCASVCLS